LLANRHFVYLHTKEVRNSLPKQLFICENNLPKSQCVLLNGLHGSSTSEVTLAGKKKRLKKTLVDPTQLKPIDKKHGILQVIIETPKGSRNKYAFDPDQEIFALKKVLPAGMAFPYDFGFLPCTIAGDGDPIDVLVLMDEPAFPGCLLRARLVGVIEGTQSDGGKNIRNDRLVAIAEANHMYAHIRKITDLPRQFLRELETFFVNYHELEGKQYKLLGCKGQDVAMRLIKQARNDAK
jgi:inorganic pyrophosphatase